MKTTILAHHGDIQITQEKNKGTRVVLYIPLGKQHLKNDENVCFIEPETIMEDSDKAMITAEDKRQQEIANSITAKPIDNPETKYKLLVVEDHADIRLYLRVLFSATYNIIMAENGEEGVRMARKEIPDLVITDVMIPVMRWLVIMTSPPSESILSISMAPLPLHLKVKKIRKIKNNR